MQRSNLFNFGSGRKMAFSSPHLLEILGEQVLRARPTYRTSRAVTLGRSGGYPTSMTLTTRNTSTIRPCLKKPQGRRVPPASTSLLAAGYQPMPGLAINTSERRLPSTAAEMLVLSLRRPPARGPVAEPTRTPPESEIFSDFYHGMLEASAIFTYTI